VRRRATRVRPGRPERSLFRPCPCRRRCRRRCQRRHGVAGRRGGRRGFSTGFLFVLLLPFVLGGLLPFRGGVDGIALLLLLSRLDPARHRRLRGWFGTLALPQQPAPASTPHDTNCSFSLTFLNRFSQFHAIYRPIRRLLLSFTVNIEARYKGDGKAWDKLITIASV